MDSKKISVILPCYNPDKNWVVNILIRYSEIINLLSTYSFELIIVNDGSSYDISKDLDNICQNFKNTHVISYQENKGKGYAIREGMKKTTGDLIVYTDIDFPYTNESFINICEGLKDSDLTIGTRGENYYKNIPSHRALISKLLKFLVKTSLRIPTNDTQGGLKGIKSSSKAIFLETETNRYLFDLEFVCLAAKNKLQIKLIPVILCENTTVRRVSIKIVSKELINLFKIYIKMMFH
jgi:glycosyltransferase involved in cell wall biosynthesis